VEDALMSCHVIARHSFRGRRVPNIQSPLLELRADFQAGAAHHKQATCHDAATAMADGTPSKVNAPGARGLGADHTLPPPSTLAAQLVENLSPSAKSSRSDENRELKSLFAIIQQVKDNPELLRSHAERVEHNHMLIYVYSRVVLDNIKPDDPFLDASHICTEALRAINFLRFTIKETPSVLAYTGQHGFVFRGREPLWIWLLPRLLRILGHTKLHRLDDSIEGFLQYLMLVVARNGILWEVAPQLSSYLRAIVTGKILSQPVDWALANFPVRLAGQARSSELEIVIFGRVAECIFSNRTHAEPDSGGSLVIHEPWHELSYPEGIPGFATAVVPCQGNDILDGVS
jgi:hypothetical protein